MTRVGTLRWADETGGRLTLGDRLALLIGQGVPTRIEELAERALTSFRPPKWIDPHVEIPATPIAEAAAQLSKEISPPWLLAHCDRTFAIGALLGRRSSFDSEMLFVASMLHDVGLTDAFSEGSDPGLVPEYARKDAPCFAVRGAGVAQSLATAHGWPSARSRALAESISLHLNMRIGRSRVEAHLLNAGSAFDVIRLMARRLPNESIRSVESRWPRDGGFCEDIRAAWVRESELHRDCRGAFLNSWGSFERRYLEDMPQPSARSRPLTGDRGGALYRVARLRCTGIASIDGITHAGLACAA